MLSFGDFKILLIIIWKVCFTHPVNLFTFLCKAEAVAMSMSSYSFGVAGPDSGAGGSDPVEWGRGSCPPPDQQQRLSQVGAPWESPDPGRGHTHRPGRLGPAGAASSSAQETGASGKHRFFVKTVFNWRI